MVDIATIQVKSDTRGLKKGEVALDSFARKGERTERRIKSSSSGMATSMRVLGAAAAAAFAVTRVASIAIGFQDLRTSLQAVTGSAENAAKAFGLINSVVGKTPFTVTQLAQSFIKLTSAGLTPTTEQLMLFSDVASITTDRIGTLQAITDLYARTTAGGLGLEDLNRLADRGVPVFKILNDELGISRLEISKMGQSAEGAAVLLGALERGLRDVAGGASELASKNLSVALSNLGDAIRSAVDVMFNLTGATGGLAGVIQGAATAIQGFNEVMKTGFVPVVKVAAVAVVALASAQIPALIASMATATTGLTIMTVATGAFTAAVNIARFAVVAFGGPIGIVWGLIGAIGASLILFKDNFKTASTAMDDAQASSKALNVALGVFYFTAAPKAGKEAISLANDNYKLADSALAAAEATLAQMEALRAASTSASAGMGGMAQFINTTTTPEQMAAAASAVRDATSALDEARASRERAARAVTGAMSEDMADTVDINRELTVSIDSATTAISGQGGMAAAVETLADKMDDMLKSAIGNVADAFADFLGRGFRDFKGFARSIISTFKNMLLQMIAMAAKNKIMISLGLGGSALGGVASAGTSLLGGGGGLLGGIGAAIGGGLGAVGAGTAAGFASGGIGGAVGGFFSSTAAGVSGGLAAGGVAGIGAAIGAALPIIGIGLLLFSLFKKKPPYKEKDFKAIQNAIALTNVELLNTNKAGQKAATGLKKAFGGLENMQRATESYYNNFFTAEEKRQRAIESINGVFNNLGLTVPASATAFRDLVEAQDLMSKGGRDTYSALIQVSEAFAAVYGGVNNTTAALNRLDGINPFSTLVDQQRAALLTANGVGFDLRGPQQVGGGFAFRDNGPRVAIRKTEFEGVEEAIKDGNTDLLGVLLGLFKTNKRALEIYDQWEVDGLPPTRA